MDPPSMTAESIVRHQQDAARPKPAPRRSLWSAPWLLVVAVVKLGPRELNERYVRDLTDGYT